jgi:hypothetical protein
MQVYLISISIYLSHNTHNSVEVCIIVVAIDISITNKAHKCHCPLIVTNIGSERRDVCSGM